MSLDFDSARLKNPYLTPEHEEYRSQIRRFVEREIMPFAAEWDEAGQIPDEIRIKAAEMGLLGMGYPEEYGGITEGIDLWYNNIVGEELSRTGVGGFTAALLGFSIGLPPVSNFGSEALKQEIIPAVVSGHKVICLGLTEPDVGSDLANLKTTAKRVTEGGREYYLVNGSKTFITGGMRSSWITTAVRTGGEGGAGVSALLIPMDLEGVSRTQLARKQGWWCSDTATIYFDNVKVPVENLLGEENQGFKVFLNNLNAERMSMIVQMEAYSRVCLEEAVNWAQQRKTFGKRLADHQVIRHKIAEMKQRINACQAMIIHSTREVMEGTAKPADIGLLKVMCSQTMEFCAREASQILGGACYLRDNRVERIYREVRVQAIGGGSEEIMRDLASREYGL
ncbi:acyl-CoA dehydrogenase [Pseudomaricurvus alkylphenolicus]|uniref:acyl-CoA dehydrogenase family protein n=1 Tax=Pseudomaricurvus alkylphenolicus TaxID=1306991 RepID=UPI00141F8622|nr:acyl-CoA dehydrogenase family protein [Pseudomaricurvus alkylphenolicus]NIB44685.1 acyl-CoA dehydrogenase [Pseudomaricurvus alkylphenolicus]